MIAGEFLVSGGADKQVIIWGGTPYEGQLKFPHSDSIQKVAYSPVAQQILSCTSSDIGQFRQWSSEGVIVMDCDNGVLGLWTPELKSVAKSKVASRCCDCCWTNDGQYFAIGHMNGTITVWTKVL